MLLVNAARRGEVLPDTLLLHVIAPFAPLGGLFVLTGAALRQRAAAGRLGLVGFAVNAIGLVGGFGIEYTLHHVFPSLDRGTIDTLLDGPTGTAFLVTSVIVLAGVLLFSASALRAGVLPRGAVLLYGLGMIPGSLRNVVPEPAYLGGLVVAAAGIAWLSVTLLRTDAD